MKIHKKELISIAPRRNTSSRSQWTARPRQDTDIPCKIKDSCATCAYINQDYRASLDEKYNQHLEILKATNLFTQARLIGVTSSPMPLSYRTHAKLAVRQSNEENGTQRFDIGLFKPKTHQVVNLDECPLHRHTINKLLADLRPALEASSLEPYNEANHSGDLRYIAIRASHLTEELMVTFVVTKDVSIELKPMVAELKRGGHKIASAYINHHSEGGNAIFGHDSKRIIGADRLRESLCGLEFEIGPTSFFQVNPWQAEIIYRRVAQLAGERVPGYIAWDLYCGTGTLSMILARSGYRVLGIEENPQATRDAQYNVTRNELENQPHFIAGRVEECLANLPGWAETPNIIVANPSRRGMQPEVRKELARIMAKSNSQLIYVSCEATTLARDLEDLCQYGAKPRQAEAFDMFPFTDKLEWIVVVS